MSYAYGKSNFVAANTGNGNKLLKKKTMGYIIGLQSQNFSLNYWHIFQKMRERTFMKKSLKCQHVHTKIFHGKKWKIDWFSLYEEFKFKIRVSLTDFKKRIINETNSFKIDYQGFF